jgi:hypothetical protein
MKYIIKHKIKENKYIINITCKIPNIIINNKLNFRIYNTIYNNGSKQQDPDIENSIYIFEINPDEINKDKNFCISLDTNSIRSYKSIVIGFCDELVKWHDDTFFEILIDKKLLNSAKNIENKIFENQVCMLSSWGIKCGISQYSKNIIDALEEKNIKTKVFPHTSEYSDVFSFMKNSSTKSFIVQYEPSLISDFNELKINIIKLKIKKTKIFFIIHSEYKQLLELDGLIDGFIYHKDNTMKFEKTKIYKIPMGVPIFNPEYSKNEYRKIYNIPENKLIISTIGFMFAWKNHANVLSGLLKYMKEEPRILVQYMTSFHSINNGECIDEFNKITSIVKENNLESQFIHITDYISQKELNERLYLSDVGFLWSGIETTSSSASLKEFVSSRLPLVKTNSTHYHDIISGSITTEQEINIFCNKIIQLILDNNRCALLKEEMNENYNSLNYKTTINNMLGIIDV